MNPFYDYKMYNCFDWNKFYKELKFTVRCIPMFTKPVNEKIKKTFIMIKKFFKIQKR